MQEHIQQPKEQYVNTWTWWSYKVRAEQPNPKEAKENILKYNFLKMIKTLKEEMKNSLKEIEKNTNKKLAEISKSLLGNQEKNKQVKETV